MQNEKKLVVLFPGFGYGPDKPLLYYAAKVARRQGLDCMVVDRKSTRLNSSHIL